MNITKLTTAICFLLLFCCLPSCSNPPAVKSAKIGRSNIEAAISSVNSGTVKCEQVAELAFGAVGRVKKLNVDLGDIVEKNFIIAEIENEDMQSALETATRELERQRSLLEKKLSSPTLLDQAKSSLQMAQGAYDKTLIRAPFGGLIAELNLEVGQLSQITAEFSQALVRLVDLEPRYIRAEIDEVDMPRIKLGQSARVKILAVRKEPFEAVVRKVVPFVSSVREQDRTAEIELTLKTSEILPVGASGDVEIIVDYKENVLTAPVKSISSVGGKRFAFRLDNGKAKKTEVQLGLSNYDSAEIISGLNEGDVVLIPGDAVEIEDGLKVMVE